MSSKRNLLTSPFRGVRRRIAVWILWSPRRAMLVLAGLSAVVAWGVVNSVPSVPQATTDGPGTRAAAEASDTGALRAQTDPWGPTVDPRAQSTPSARAADESYARARARDRARENTVSARAQEFAAAWLRAHEMSPDEWVAGLKPLVEPELVPYIEATPAEVIPQAEVVMGDATATTPYAARATVRLSNGDVMLVSLAFNDGEWGEWLVTDYGKDQ